MRIAELTKLSELEMVGDLCRAVWGPDDEPENPDLLLAMVHEGALCMGCWDGDQLIGYLFGFPTADATVQHSHRLAIRQDYQGSGLGAAMKFAQRDWCLARNITMIRWTYDPARLVNARFNLIRLGARGVRYLANYYGDMPGINAGAPSDRIMTEWDLTDAPQHITYGPGEHVVELPNDFAAILRDDPKTAMEWRTRHRDQLAPLLTDGWFAVDVRAGQAGLPVYVLRRPSQVAAAAH